MTMAFGGGGYGIQAMLKEGHKHLSGLDEARLPALEGGWLTALCMHARPAAGMNKMIINHLDKLFVTSDAATIVGELEVQHPAARLLVMAGKAQQQEVGDGTNLVVTLAGELLQGADDLIRAGLHPSEIIAGYGKAAAKALELLELAVEPESDTIDVRNVDEVTRRMLATVASKQFGQEGILCPLIADACIQVCPKNPANFNVDNVRVAKLVGGGVHDCSVIRGLVLKSDAAGTIKRATKAKVAVFGGGVDTAATETKGTVLIESAAQLEGYAKTEEAKVEQLIREVAESGATVIVSGSSVGEMALHFCERYKYSSFCSFAVGITELFWALDRDGPDNTGLSPLMLMVLKISSKFELRRFCRTTGSVSLVKLGRPSADELGHADSIAVEEIGGTKVVVVKNESGGNLVSTIVVRGSTDSVLDDIERAIDGGVNSYKAMCKDSRLVPGAGATEIELAKGLKDFARKETGLDQFAINKFGESLEVVPRTLAENAGLNSTEMLSSLYAAHASGDRKAGLDVDGGAVRDMTTENIWDLYLTKYWAVKLAADAVCTVLRVDQIIMAKPAGGPRKGAGPMDEGDD
eukprot:SM000020S06089  [mRNA]  locus=s20:955321:958889:- [translate_table: standard]